MNGTRDGIISFNFLFANCCALAQRHSPVGKLLRVTECLSTFLAS